jgi:hypothetical protein
MPIRSKYELFDLSQIRTYPLRTRKNKVKYSHLVFPDAVERFVFDVPDATRIAVERLAEVIISHRNEGKPVVLFSGAHLIKNGLGPLIVDLLQRNLLTLMAGNGATAIHDFELALIGETSEDVPDALGKGLFGMAFEFAYINTALSLGDTYQLGFGESLGKMICDSAFRDKVLSLTAHENSPTSFAHPEVSVLANCYQRDIPFTVHAGIGVDVIDQHPSFDGRVKGGCSGRDFLMFTQEMTKFTAGGIVINVGSAVHGPEVLLKAISMAANIGKAPHAIVTADFDLRDYDPQNIKDEASAGYYYRDQKSIVTRIPNAFQGSGFYIQGDQKQTVPLLYQSIIERL